MIRRIVTWNIRYGIQREHQTIVKVEVITDPTALTTVVRGFVL